MLELNSVVAAILNGIMEKIQHVVFTEGSQVILKCISEPAFWIFNGTTVEGKPIFISMCEVGHYRESR